MENTVKYLPLCLFAIYATKLLALGASFVDAPILLIMGAIATIYEIKSQIKLIRELQKDVALLKINKEDTDKIINDVKTHINGIKLAQNIRSSSLNGR